MFVVKKNKVQARMERKSFLMKLPVYLMFHSMVKESLFDIIFLQERCQQFIINNRNNQNKQLFRALYIKCVHPVMFAEGHGNVSRDM